MVVTYLSMGLVQTDNYTGLSAGLTIFKELLADRANELQNTCTLLEALVKKTSSEFGHRLAERVEIRSKGILREIPDDPMGLLDLQGPGFVRLARDRAMQVTIKSVYLPLELLDVA